jgi:hypothetical protein
MPLYNCQLILSWKRLDENTFFCCSRFHVYGNGVLWAVDGQGAHFSHISTASTSAHQVSLMDTLLIKKSSGFLADTYTPRKCSPQEIVPFSLFTCNSVSRLAVSMCTVLDISYAVLSTEGHISVIRIQNECNIISISPNYDRTLKSVFMHVRRITNQIRIVFG